MEIQQVLVKPIQFGMIVYVPVNRYRALVGHIT